MPPLVKKIGPPPLGIWNSPTYGLFGRLLHSAAREYRHFTLRILRLSCTRDFPILQKMFLCSQGTKLIAPAMLATLGHTDSE